MVLFKIKTYKRERRRNSVFILSVGFFGDIILKGYVEGRQIWKMPRKDQVAHEVPSHFTHLSSSQVSFDWQEDELSSLIKADKDISLDRDRFHAIVYPKGLLYTRRDCHFLSGISSVLAIYCPLTFF